MYQFFKPVRVAQLVNVKCGPNKWHMILGSNPITDDILNLPSASCCRAVNTPKFGSTWRVLRAWL